MPGELLLEAYPLTWPDGRTRIPSSLRREGRFVIGFARARDEMMEELGRLGAKKIIVSSNVPVRKDGLPYADSREPTDPAVAVYFERQGKQYVFACDSYRKVAHNVRAIGATVEAFRAINRHGATEMMEQAFRGFQALSAKPAARHWSDVFGMSPAAERVEVEKRYYALAHAHHPDFGGSNEKMTEINLAYAEARADLDRQERDE